MGLANEIRKAEGDLRAAKLKATPARDVRGVSSPKPYLGIKEGETGEQAAARFRAEYEASPRGIAEAKRNAQRPRVEALAQRIRRLSDERDIIAAIEGDKLPVSLMGMLADEFNIDLGGSPATGGGTASKTRAQRLARISSALAGANRRGNLGGIR